MPELGLGYIEGSIMKLGSREMLGKGLGLELWLLLLIGLLIGLLLLLEGFEGLDDGDSTEDYSSMIDSLDLMMNLLSSALKLSICTWLLRLLSIRLAFIVLP